MGKFVIECPSCGRYAEASTGGIFGIGKTRTINCSCGYVINVKTDKMATRKCAHCGNEVVFDQSKGDAVCPVCHNPINNFKAMNSLLKFSCPSCSCSLEADKSTGMYTCPLCDTVIDVQAQVKKEELSKEGLASVIKYEGDADTLVWKHPIEDFNMGSQLIVHESQEAIFFRDGQALDLFGAGRYALETNQLPIMEKLYKLPSDTDKTFHSEVYFINIAQQMAFKWGTSEKITMIDPTSQAPIAIGARGLFNFHVADSRKFLLKMVGTTGGMARGDIFDNTSGAKQISGANSQAKNYFRSIVQLGVSTKLAEIITANHIDILQIDQQKMVLSDALKESLLTYFDDYGMAITEFLVEGIILPQPGELGYDVVQTLIKLRQASLTKSVIATETDIKLTEMEAKKTIDIRTEQNKVEVETAHRETVAAKGQTEILETQIEGQKKIVGTQAEVQAERLKMELEMQRKAQTAQIEAEEMRAKGFNQKDVIQGQVLTAFAENQPTEGGSMSGIAGSALQMGAGFATMGAMAGMATNMMGTGAQLGKDMMNGMQGSMMGMPGGNPANPNANGFDANGNPVNTGTGGNAANSGVAPGGFDLNNTANSGLAALSGLNASNMPGYNGNPAQGGAPVGNNGMPGQPIENALRQPGGDSGASNDANGWSCSACGATGIKSKFCPECGAKKPEPVVKPNVSNGTWNCPNCGATDITSKFCPECGSKKPEAEAPATWTCPNCGATGITSKFCPECGTPKN
ncbi:MAG: SPFH domain-containing protein [Lachnospiraceae bacterium]|nr:SPFH domain-containing protein [Lachnospiraceae bacterium]